MDWKLSYDLIKPTEEETCNSNILEIYDSISRFSTIPWFFRKIGQWEEKMDEEMDFDAREYLHRIFSVVRDEVKIDKMFYK